MDCFASAGILGIYVAALRRKRRFQIRRSELNKFSVASATDPQTTAAPDNRGWQPEKAVRNATAQSQLLGV